MQYLNAASKEPKYGTDVMYPEDTLDPNVKKEDSWGLQYAKSMYADFRNGRARVFYEYRDQMQENRDLARGGQDPDQFKRRLDDDDMEESFLNIDWRIVAIPARFIDATIGKMIEFDNPITLTAIDSVSIDKKRTAYWKKYAQIKNQEFLAAVEQVAGAKMTGQPDGDEPQTIEELDLYNALGNFKMNEEIAMEQSLELMMFEKNEWREKEKKLKRDILVDGIAGTKTTFLASGFPNVRACDAINLVLPYSKYPDFRDAPHIGEIIPYTLAELRKLAGNKLSEEDYKDIAKKFCKRFGNDMLWDDDRWYTRGRNGIVGNPYDTLAIPVMEFEVKTVDSTVYKRTVNQTGNVNYFKVDYNYDPENGKKSDSKNQRTRVGVEYEMTYSGGWIVTTDYIVGWGCNHNVPRDPTNLFKCYREFNIYAPEMQNGMIIAKAERMLPFGNAIQLSWLKLQALKANAAPRGYAIEISGLMDVPMGAKGAVVTPLELIKMHRQTGVLAWSRKNIRGELANFKPIEPMENGMGAQAQEYINDINFNIEMIRSVTGINENSDASTPNPNQPVYTAKLAVMATNNALATVYDAYKFIKLGTARSLLDKIQCLVRYGKMDGFTAALGEATMKIIQIGSDMAFSEFGIMVDDLPTDQDRAWLDKQIENALAQRTNTHTGGIELEDAMMIRTIQNVKLAYRMLIVRRKRREQLDEKMKQQAILMNGQVQDQSAETANLGKMQADAAAHKNKLEEIHLTKTWDYVIAEVNKGSVKDDIKYKTDMDFLKTLLGQHHEAGLQENQIAADKASQESTTNQSPQVIQSSVRRKKPQPY